MCDNERLNKYASWIDEATSKEELLDTRALAKIR